MTTFFSVSKKALPYSTVLPLSLSSSFVSMHLDWKVKKKLKSQIYHERAHDSLFFSFDSRSYFSSVLASTIPVSFKIWPDIVDFPASTCPIKTMLTKSKWTSSSSTTSSGSSTGSGSLTGSFTGSGSGFFSSTFGSGSAFGGSSSAAGSSLSGV